MQNSSEANTRLLLGILLQAKRDDSPMWRDFLKSGIQRGDNVDTEAAVWWIHEYISGNDHPDSIPQMISEDIHGK